MCQGGTQKDPSPLGLSNASLINLNATLFQIQIIPSANEEMLSCAWLCSKALVLL